MFKNLKVPEQKSKLHIYNKELMNNLKVPELREIARSQISRTKRLVQTQEV